MSPASLEGYLVVGAVLFALGMVGFLTTLARNMIIMFLSAEMMLQGVAVNLVAFAKFRGDLGGQVLILFMLTVAACEAAIALALILMLYRASGNRSMSAFGRNCAKPDREPIQDEERRCLTSRFQAGDLPEHLTPAGAGPPPANARNTEEVSPCLVCRIILCHGTQSVPTTLGAGGPPCLILASSASG